MASVYLRAVLACVLLVSGFGLQPLVAQSQRGASTLIAHAAVVVDARDGSPLFVKNPDARMHPASTTKILTALVAIESGRLDETVTIQNSDLQVVPSIIGLRRGERISLRDLVYGLLLRSGNDAARAIARHLSGSQVRFAERMNARVRELGCQDTHFVNAHGLTHRHHYTTARDLSRIMVVAMRNPEFRAMTATRAYVSRSSLRQRTFKNKNKLLHLYEGTLGGKPGYTKAAQQTLVAAASKQDHEVVAVCLRSYGKALWSDTMRLFDVGFARLAESPVSGTSRTTARE